MARAIAEILTDFHALNATEYDFRLGNYEGQERVKQLCDELMNAPHPEQAIPTLFAVFERLPDADFGAPGALVHTLEKLPGFESELAASVRRKPTYYTVWMVNRILNSLSNAAEREEQRAVWMDLLRGVSAHPFADEVAREEAQNFITFQQNREIKE